MEVIRVLKSKLALIITLLMLICLVLSGCNDNQANDIKAGDAIRFLDGVTVDYSNMFFDDFTGGVDYDSWYIGKQAWGANENGGVIPENVNYTDEGVLLFSGDGGYYTSGDVQGVGARKDGSLTGGALISKFVTGPGRYQVKMKVLPRLGACSAFWTYCFEQSTGGNHEIDIELPGGKDHSSVISFENVLNTNYITVEMNESQDVNISNVTGSDTTIALNDGQWHTFGFDWYTDPEMVVYYVDGIVTAVSRIFVPYVQSRVWLGVWFPNNTGFVGDANFESDIMSVDYVQYIPFLDQPCQSYDPPISSSQVAAADEYPVAPVSTAVVNKISNGNFEYVLDHNVDGYGWVMDARYLFSDEETKIRNEIRQQVIDENGELTSQEVNRIVAERYREKEREILSIGVNEMCSISNGIGYRDSCGLHLTDLGLLRQVIDGVYANFNLNLQFKSKGVGKVIIQFETEGGLSVISEQLLDVDDAEFTAHSLQVKAPVGTRQVTILITSVYGGELFADDFVLNIN